MKPERQRYLEQCAEIIWKSCRLRHADVPWPGTPCAVCLRESAPVPMWPMEDFTVLRRWWKDQNNQVWHNPVGAGELLAADVPAREQASM